MASSGSAREHRRRPRALGSGQGGRRMLVSCEQARQHATHVRVENQAALSEGERPHGRCRVLPHPRQCPQRPGVGRHLPVLIRDRHRRRVQAERAPGVAEPIPLAHGFARGVGSQTGRGRPPPHPGLPHRKHANHGRLLQHDLRREDAPRRAVLGPPRQVPAMRVEPPDDTRDQCRGIHRPGNLHDTDSGSSGRVGRPAPAPTLHNAARAGSSRRTSGSRSSLPRPSVRSSSIAPWWA